MNYKSKASLFGLPLVHVATGDFTEGAYRRGVARSWIAVGDIAIGLLVAIGGVALGTGLTLGGLGIGLLTFAGLAIGGFAMGGAAFGYIAIGGLAVASKGAIGGAAISGEYAIGGDAQAPHANDAVAEKFFEEDLWSSLADAVQNNSEVMAAIAVLVVFVILMSRLSGDNRDERL